MDTWTVVCPGNNPVNCQYFLTSLICYNHPPVFYLFKIKWRRDGAVKLKHKGTEKFLAASGQQFNRPINGQLEIVAQAKSGGATEWKTAEGVFVSPQASTSHDEL